jgi:hypothetical protein
MSEPWLITSKAKAVVTDNRQRRQILLEVTSESVSLFDVVITII